MNCFYFDISIDTKFSISSCRPLLRALLKWLGAWCPRVPCPRQSINKGPTTYATCFFALHKCKPCVYSSRITKQPQQSLWRSCSAITNQSSHQHRRIFQIFQYLLAIIHKTTRFLYECNKLSVISVSTASRIPPLYNIFKLLHPTLDIWRWFCYQSELCTYWLSCTLAHMQRAHLRPRFRVRPSQLS